MSRIFGQIHLELWRDSWFRSLPCDAQKFYLYLITGPASEQAGIYKLPLDYMSFESQLPVERLREILAQFARDGKVWYDEPTETVYVNNMREYQGGDSTSFKTVAGVKNVLAGLRDSKLKRAYIAKYMRGMEAPSEAQEAPSMGLTEAEEAPSCTKTTPDKTTQDNKDESEGEQASPSASASGDVFDPEGYANVLERELAYLRSKKPLATEKAYNPTAAVARVFTARYGTKTEPSFARLGRLYNQLSGGEATLCEMIWRNNIPEGDPHDYLQAIVNKSGARKAKANGATNGSAAAPAKTLDLAAAQRERERAAALLRAQDGVA
jgi:hypothetical protein